MKDNLKIEINYMLRCHVLPVSRRPVYLPWNDQELTVLNVDPLEIFSAKTVALLNRAAPRDLYDMFNMQKYGLFDETQEPLFRKCIMFYAAIASETVPEYFDLNGIGSISARKIRTDLTPVLRRGERFDLACAQKQVKDYLAAILKPEDTELSFWQAFAEGNYQPGLLFDDADILSRVEHHPMALWKCGGGADAKVKRYTGTITNTYQGLSFRAALSFWQGGDPDSNHKTNAAACGKRAGCVYGHCGHH